MLISNLGLIIVDLGVILMVKEVSIKKVREEAESQFRQGNFYCSEAVVYSIRKYFDNDMPEALISAASGFPIGIGKSKCVCGAVSGGILSIGYFFGRTKGADPVVQDTLKLANELQESFRKNHGCLCCHVHTRGMDMASGEHKNQCISFTGEIAEKAAEIIARERNIKVID